MVILKEIYITLQTERTTKTILGNIQNHIIHTMITHHLKRENWPRDLQ